MLLVTRIERIELSDCNNCGGCREHEQTIFMEVRAMRSVLAKAAMTRD